MLEFDKIRILWIDDREEESYPEQELPDECRAFFEVTHYSRSLYPQSFGSTKEFAPVLKDFWFAGNTNVLPAEIIVMDYNLRKWLPKTASREPVASAEREFQEYDGRSSKTGEHLPEASASKAEPREVNFEGLLIGLFYGSLTYEHPAGLVPMTFYSAEMPAEVHTLHELAEPFLGVDFRTYGTTSHKERTWERLIEQGVRQLRQRLKGLLKKDMIHISLQNVMDLSVGSQECSTLTIDTRYVTRRLPVEGLFIDYESEERPAAIRKWADDLVRDTSKRIAAVSEGEELDDGFYQQIATDLRDGIRFADALWNAYCDKDNDKMLFEKRWRLSKLLQERTRQSPSNQDPDELEELAAIFGVDLSRTSPSCTKLTLDFGHEGCSDRAKRWAALFIIVRLLQVWHDAKWNWGEKCEEMAVPGLIFRNMRTPLTSHEVYLALHPRATTPVVLPYHHPKKDPSSSWEYRFKQLHSDKAGDSQAKEGNLQLRIQDVLDGHDWEHGKKRPKGLLPGERWFLRQYAAGIGFSRKVWRRDLYVVGVLD